MQECGKGKKWEEEETGGVDRELNGGGKGKDALDERNIGEGPIA